MALRFKLVNRTTKLEGKSKTIYFAKSSASGVTTKEQVVSLVEKISAVSSGDVKSVLDTLSTILAMEMKSGRIVDLGDLGRFRMSARSKAAGKEEEFTRKNFLQPRVLFVPGAEIMRARKEVSYELANLVREKKGGSNSPTGGTPSQGGTAHDPSAGGNEGGATPNPSAGGNEGGATPNPSAGGNEGGATPNPSAGGNEGGTTPNPSSGGNEGEGTSF